MNLKRFLVTIKTASEIKHLPVLAESSADALIKLADRIPPFGMAKVTVSPA